MNRRELLVNSAALAIGSQLPFGSNDDDLTWHTGEEAVDGEMVWAYIEKKYCDAMGLPCPLRRAVVEKENSLLKSVAFRFLEAPYIVALSRMDPEKCFARGRQRILANSLPHERVYTRHDFVCRPIASYPAVWQNTRSGAPDPQRCVAGMVCRESDRSNMIYAGRMNNLNITEVYQRFPLEWESGVLEWRQVLGYSPTRGVITNPDPDMCVKIWSLNPELELA
jgi:hypothetical protein